MRLFDVFLLLSLTLFSVSAPAGVERRSQDLKLPSQVMLEKQTIATPIVASATRIVSGTAGATSAAAATLTTFTAQPDVPRNITITPTGTTGDVEACTIVVTGKDILNGTITENFAFLADASSAVVGARAFKSVTSVYFPASCESGGFAATWNIGVGSKLGMKKCMDFADYFFHAGLAGVKEGTAPTITAHATEVSKNTATLSGTLDGTKNVTLWFAQNFRCN